VIGSNLLYRWFIDWPVERSAFTSAVVSLNRDRLVEARGRAGPDPALAPVTHPGRCPASGGCVEAAQDDLIGWGDLSGEQRPARPLPEQRQQYPAEDTAARNRPADRERNPTPTAVA